MANFESGRTKVPADSKTQKASAAQAKSDLSVDIASTVEVPVAKNGAATGLSPTRIESAEEPAVASSAAMSDEELAKVLNVKSVKVKELQSAVLKAQMGQK